MFGTRYVGAIHGMLITAWSVAGVFGPVLVNYIRQYQIDHGVPKAHAYNVTMYIMAGAAGDRLHLQLLHQGSAAHHIHMSAEEAEGHGGLSGREREMANIKQSPLRATG